jgi:D-glycero-alpha-D-manno-heptose-7-phosphate kinase
MIIVRSPLRISFAGGGTDLREYYRDGFGAVCSMAIDKYVHVAINNFATYFPHRFRIAYSQIELTQDAASIKHPIVRETLKLHNIRGGIDISVMADIPAGTGMGSSSTFTVSMLHALHAFRNRLASKEQLAEEASRIEIDLLKEPIGKQDQYAASFGGINLFRFHANEQVSVEPLPMSRQATEQLTSHLMLFYLGGNRDASAILRQQSSKMRTHRSELDKMREQALRCAQILTGVRPLEELGELLYEGWLLKKRLAEDITNPSVDAAVEGALQAGASGGKLLGAGGTGFLLLFVRPDRHDPVRKAMSGYPQVCFGVDTMGSSLIYYTG